MDNYKLPKIVAIIGPTASGKSDLAIKLAKRFSGEIISADSRQIYKGMDIGTGKVTKKEMAGIPHYLLDVVSPQRTFTVVQYQKRGSEAIKKILSKGKLPIIVGGTGFYIDALLYNYKLPSVKPNLKLRRELEKKSSGELFEKLESLDPVRAETIDRHNKVRLIRAIEIVIATKKPVPELKLWQVQDKKPLYDFLKIGIKLSDEKLKKRIEKRVGTMLKKGLVDEVKKLVKKYGPKQVAFGTIGYREIINYLAADKNGLNADARRQNKLPYKSASSLHQSAHSPKEVVEMINKNTWSFAKRQMTWFRKDKKIKWVSKKEETVVLAKKFLNE